MSYHVGWCRAQRNPQMIHLRIFISSPGDVTDERELARKVIDRLQYQYPFHGRLTLETVSWDRSGAEVPMEATLTPQEAIDEGLAKPSECDIVIVILWSRMGTPLPAEYTKPDGSTYLSGMEWEYCDALKAAQQQKGKPIILLYHRSEVPAMPMNDPEKPEKERQWDRVQNFLASFQRSDGSIKGGINNYDAPSDFEEKLERQLRTRIGRLFEKLKTDETVETFRSGVKPSSPPLWQGSPFPGLQAFTEKHAPIFFGRSRETDGLVRKLSESDTRFVIVVGASGSGKSSLVAAGLLPRLKAGAIQGSDSWRYVRFLPGGMGDNPFLALAVSLLPQLESHDWRAPELAESILENSLKLAELLPQVPHQHPTLLLFIDQFEELFTLVATRYREPFMKLLTSLSENAHVCIVATMRADFYAQCVESPVLAELLRAGSYPLAAPGMGVLREMIARPAERAGLSFEEDFVDRILDDTGTAPGSLALMAFALSQLYEARTSEGRLTHTAYDRFGGVKGAIGDRAENTYSRLGHKVQESFSSVFRDLLSVDEQGVATRRRAIYDRICESPEPRTLVDNFTNARLLVTGRGKNNVSTVEVAHEALLTHWPRLDEWIEAWRDDLRLRHQVKAAAEEWQRQGQNTLYVWPHERLQPVYATFDRLGIDRESLEEPLHSFIRPEAERLLEELENPHTTHYRRAEIGDRLNQIGDPRYGIGVDKEGTPQIDWVDVPGGRVKLEEHEGTFDVEPFYIACFPVTYRQYRAFLEASDGFQNDQWWKGLQREEPGEQYRPTDNCPAENVSWYDAVAFSRWLSARLSYEIRLPKEEEWQQAATGGNADYIYPWGPEWKEGLANTDESRLSRTTAVGMYPGGQTVQGVLDMSGNVWEWCLNKYEKPKDTSMGENVSRVVRGGSWLSYLDYALATYRYLNSPVNRYGSIGFRLCCSAPIK